MQNIQINKLRSKIQEKYPDKNGNILLISNFEKERYRFRQESSVYYFTGISEPGVVCSFSIGAVDNSTIFIPRYKESRHKWANSCIYNKESKDLENLGIRKIEPLGDACPGFSILPCADISSYKNLISFLKKSVNDGQAVFTLYKDIRYSEQRLLLERLSKYVPNLMSCLIDIGDIVGKIRRNKSKSEIEKIFHAVKTTINAHEAAASIISPGKNEYEVQAGIEFVFKDAGGQPAFPSIVASGKNSTILHYVENNNSIKSGDLVVVDIGAEIDYYCADLTRTYPASGKFSTRQSEIYNIVKDTQEYISGLAKPGYWLKNNDNPNQSLHHLACKYLEERGYSDYFTHGIGHFLGMDVHDVGNYADPLQENDVITIEPGLYIQNENLGIRLEDNYWITKDGSINLSEDLPKSISDIQDLMTLKIE